MSGEKEPRQRPERERRKLVRYPTKASVTVFRQSDVMRVGLPAELRDISAAGIGLVLTEPLVVGEWVDLELTNEIQRFQKKTRGIVRHSTPIGPSRFLIGIELSLRLTPLEVLLMRMGFVSKQSEGPKWI